MQSILSNKQLFNVKYDEVKNKKKKLINILVQNNINVNVQSFLKDLIDYIKFCLENIQITQNQSVQYIYKYIQQCCEEFKQVCPSHIILQNAILQLMKIIRTYVIEKTADIDVFEGNSPDQNDQQQFVTTSKFKQEQKKMFEFLEKTFNTQQTLGDMINDNAKYLINKQDIIFAAGSGYLLGQFIANKAFQQVYIPECYPFDLKLQLQGYIRLFVKQTPFDGSNSNILQAPVVQSIQEISDSSASLFIQRCNYLLFEPLIVMRDGSCVADAPIKTFILLAHYYRKPVYGLCRSLQFSTQETLLQFIHPSKLFGGEFTFDDYGDADILVVKNAVVQGDLIDYYITDKGICLPKTVFKLF